MGSTHALLALASAFLACAEPTNETYSNPVLASEVPCLQSDPAACERADPGVTWDAAGQRWLAVTTTGNRTDGTFAVHASDDLVTWHPRGFVWGGGASRGRPSWGEGNWFAPELHLYHPPAAVTVSQTANASAAAAPLATAAPLWIMVFSALWRASGQQAVGVAFASSADGPFVDQVCLHLQQVKSAA